MVVTVTSIKLKSIWYFFRLSLFGYRIQKQAKLEPGFIKMKNTGFGYEHFTLSAWNSINDLKRFAHSGEHALAMKGSAKLSHSISTYTYEADKLPGWKEANALLKKNGKVLKFK